MESMSTHIEPQYVFVLLGRHNGESAFVMGVFSDRELANEAKDEIESESSFAPQMQIQRYEVDYFDL